MEWEDFYELIECEFNQCCDNCCFGESNDASCSCPESVPICSGGYYKKISED